MKNLITDLKTFLILWSTQSLSQLGSSMTGFALTSVVVSEDRIRTPNSSSVHLFLCPLCCYKYLCRCFQRPLEQEKNYVGM